MGATSDKTDTITNNRNRISSEFLKYIPSDQYLCMDEKCKCVPEFIGLDLNSGIITYKCIKNFIENVDIRKYLKEESEYLYNNIRCHKHENRIQKDHLPYIFNHFVESGKNLCEKCSKGKEELPRIKVNELNNICSNHLQNYIKYCKKCNIHFCNEDNQYGHTEEIELIKKPNNKDIESIKNILK